ncbi:MAG: FtsX-like permease family protein [Acidimicrobiia bacterium]|nr:FtsX-like permease family protein [Acidimicrobiia bacterium]
MAQILESALLALQAIRANTLRSFMTVLGNIVAVTAIVTVVSLIQGMNAFIGDTIVSEVGADSFMVQRVGITTTDEEIERARNNPRLTLDEARYITRFSPIVSAVMAQAQTRGAVAYRGTELEQAQIQGVSRDFAQFSTFDAERGRMITTAEVDRERPVAIIGYDTAERLFGAVDPLEKEIQIVGRPFRVVGVSARKGGMMGASQDEFVVIPLGAYEKIFGLRQSLSLLVKPEVPELMPDAMDDATVALRVRRRLKPAEPDNFGIFSSGTIMGIYQQATEGVFAVLIGVVALSLLVGGIVIMNIMLMVVSERTREIGLRKALGAKRRDIMTQVLTESVTLSTFGGVVGIVLGYLAGRAMTALSPITAQLEWWSVVLGIGVTAAVGLFFGAYPALQASRLDPVEALRRE